MEIANGRVCVNNITRLAHTYLSTPLCRRGRPDRISRGRNGHRAQQGIGPRLSPDPQNTHSHYLQTQAACLGVPLASLGWWDVGRESQRQRYRATYNASASVAAPSGRSAPPRPCRPGRPAGPRGPWSDDLYGNPCRSGPRLCGTPATPIRTPV